MLHVPPSHGASVKSWQDVVRLLRKGGAPGLVALPHDNLVMRHIAASLRRVAVVWEPTLEVSSLGHVPAYVDLDFGFGFGFAVPGSAAKKKTPRVIPLPAEKVPSKIGTNPSSGCSAGSRAAENTRVVMIQRMDFMLEW